MNANGGSEAADASPQIISFGEIVFDMIEGTPHLGGAPLNVACYIRQFGVCVGLVSAVGRDVLGETALRALKAADVNTSWVESRPQPTGTVDVRVVDGDGEFTVVDGCAWEQIELSDDFTGTGAALLYFGAAAQKTAINRATFRSLCDLGPRHILLDINLRPGQYTPELVVQVLNQATIVKMNEKEWEIVRELTSHNTLAELLENSGLDMIALTRGSAGAVLYLPEKQYAAKGPKVRVVDPIGSGDAFTAALAAGMIRGAAPEHILQVACEAGAAAVQGRGALVDLPDDLRRAFA